MPHSPGSAFGKNAPGLHNCDLHQQKNLAPTEVAKGFGGGQGTRKQAVETGKGSVGPNEVRTASGGGVPVDCTPPPNGTRSRMMQLVRDPTKIGEHSSDARSSAIGHQLCSLGAFDFTMILDNLLALWGS